MYLNDTRRRDDDEHLPVGLGTVDFESIVSSMVETGWSGTCTHEIWGYDRHYAAENKHRFDRLFERSSDNS